MRICGYLCVCVYKNVKVLLSLAFMPVRNLVFLRFSRDFSKKFSKIRCIIHIFSMNRNVYSEKCISYANFEVIHVLWKRVTREKELSAHLNTCKSKDIDKIIFGGLDFWSYVIVTLLFFLLIICINELNFDLNFFKVLV